MNCRDEVKSDCKKVPRTVIDKVCEPAQEEKCETVQREVCEKDPEFEKRCSGAGQEERCKDVQVWSLTQFYSVKKDQEKSVLSINAQSRFVSVVLDGVLGPPRHLMVSLYLCSSEATHEASQGPLMGAVSTQKALQGSETETRELLGIMEENSVSLMRGH